MVLRACALRDKGLESTEITDPIVGTSCDEDHFVMLGPMISNQTIDLAKAILCQAVER